MLTVHCYLVAVSYEWLKQYVTFYLGNTHDIYLAEYDDNSNEVVKLGSIPISEHEQLENTLLRMDTLKIV